ncbi:MAG: hypothetical protein DRJ05_11585 [Bacteroidetes bacterium]|nr:MAG: hypothetical protein DRJ05_11585 [Bacteroidota bacterium]
MNKGKINDFISKERFLPYLLKHENDFDKAIQHYESNIIISEAFYPLLSILEVSLRNKINLLFKIKYKTNEWFEHPEFIKTGSSFQIKRVTEARNSILRSKKTITSGKIISELTFGFWTSLFDSRFEMFLWKQLRLCFPNCEKRQRKRKTLSSRLNTIRKFRNRVFHYECISWDFDVLQNFADDIIETIKWLDKDLLLWGQSIFRVNDVIEQEKNKLSNYKAVLDL